MLLYILPYQWELYTLTGLHTYTTSYLLIFPLTSLNFTFNLRIHLFYHHNDHQAIFNQSALGEATLVTSQTSILIHCKHIQCISAFYHRPLFLSTANISNVYQPSIIDHPSTKTTFSVYHIRSLVTALFYTFTNPIIFETVWFKRHFVIGNHRY